MLSSKEEIKVMGKDAWMRRIIDSAWFSFSLVYASCLILGIFLVHWKLADHEECDMTWSQRLFVLVHVPTSTPYKLYKFTDGRDPRHWQLYQKSMPIRDTSFCLSTGITTAVLYVPGHSGNYEQSRSIGAHGLGLTRKSMDPAEEREIMSRRSRFDVYAVDFNEEPSALSGFYLDRQSVFVRECLVELLRKCQFNNVVVFGHSMGGLVARSAAENVNAVTAIVTLATPHTRPVLTWDASAVYWHSQLPKTNLTAIVSIMGGLRDEMIPAEVGALENALTVQAIDVMENADEPAKVSPILGMDHQAIVWCSNLLVIVKKIILDLQPTSELTSFQRLEEVKLMVSRPTHRTVVETSRLQHESLKATLMELGLVYQCEWLVWFYAFHGAWYNSFQGDLPVPVLLVICLTFSTGNFHWLAPPAPSLVSCIALATAAQAIFWVLFHLLSRLASLPFRPLFLRQTWSFAMVLLLSLWRGMIPSLLLSVVICVLAIQSLFTKNRATALLVTWLLPMYIILVGGSIIAMFNNPDALLTVRSVAVPMAMRLLAPTSLPKYNLPGQGLRVIWITLFGAGITLPTRMFHPVGLFVTVLEILDVLDNLIASKWKNK